MAKSEGQKKKKPKRQPPEEREEAHVQHDTAAAVQPRIRITAVCTSILDLKDDIVRHNVCSFLDNESVCQFIQQDTLSTHFELCKHFCSSHGTRMRSAVSKQERKEFKRRKRSAALQRLKARDSNSQRLIAVHPGCIDCSEGLDGRLRCVECNDFSDVDWSECCGVCHREACSVCFDGWMCVRCLGAWYCRDCFDGFECSECQNNYCNGCEARVCCASATCDKAACAQCAWPPCDICHRTLCEDCSPFIWCAICDAKLCVDCKRGTVHDNVYCCSTCLEQGGDD